MQLTWPAPVLPNGDRPVITSGFADHLQRTPASKTPGLDIMYPNTANVPPQRGLTSAGGNFIVEPGTPAIAPAAGIILRMESTNRGTVCEIDHGGGFVSTLRHLKNPAVTKGDGVVPGQVVADIGFDPEDTAQTPHLHYEIRLNGKLLNPAPLLAIAPVVKINTLPPDTEDERILRILRDVLRGQSKGSGLWLLGLLVLLLAASSKR